MKNRPFDLFQRKFGDWLATIAILVAGLVGVFYLGPWLAFDVLKLGVERGAEDGIADENDPNNELLDDKTLNTSLNIGNDQLFKGIDGLLMEQETATINDYLIDEEIFQSLNWQSVLKNVAQIVKNKPIVPDEVEEGRLVPVKDPEWSEEETWVVAEKIGLKAKIQASSSEEEIDEGLSQGVVAIPGYGQAGETAGAPMIVAAHRYGYLWWWDNPNYARENSFYYLPELVVGDVVEVIAGGRRWYYEIYRTSEGETIDDYQADLILYTCKYLNSKQRYFQYARLIDPSWYGTYLGTEGSLGTEMEYVSIDEQKIVVEVEMKEDKVVGGEEVGTGSTMME